MSEVGTLTLTEFLLARIAEDEAVAREVGDEMIAMFNGPRVRALDLPRTAIRPDFQPGMTYEADPTGVVEVHPARVLADCEAKRRIVERMSAVHAVALDNLEVDLSDFAELAEWTLRLLALPYADHPDYREEWKP